MSFLSVHILGSGEKYVCGDALFRERGPLEFTSSTIFCNSTSSVYRSPVLFASLKWRIALFCAPESTRPSSFANPLTIVSILFVNSPCNLGFWSMTSNAAIEAAARRGGREAE